jgi:hypothetical protein
VYLLAYGGVRATHRLVRYEPGCVARGGLEGRDRDFWIWEFRGSKMRAYFAAQDPLEIVFAPLVSFEELARDPLRKRPSICALAPSPLPSQGFTRPPWCGPWTGPSAM